MEKYKDVSIEQLRENLTILSGSYWENFKYVKDIEKTITIDNPKLKKLIDDLNSYSKEMNELKNYIKEREAENL